MIFLLLKFNIFFGRNFDDNLLVRLTAADFVNLTKLEYL